MTTADSDTLLDEPDPRYCDEHNQPVPCMACAADHADRQYDSQCDKEAS